MDDATRRFAKTGSGQARGGTDREETFILHRRRFHPEQVERLKLCLAVQAEAEALRAARAL
jgi:hypothetical protein